jgi:hypothetical protein
VIDFAAKMKTALASIPPSIAGLLGIGGPGLVRRLREAALRGSAARVFGTSAKGGHCSWQPWWLLALKLILIAALGLWAYSFQPRVAGFISASIDFVKLTETFGGAKLFKHSIPAGTLPSLIAAWGMAALIIALLAPLALRTLATAFAGLVAVPGTDSAPSGEIYLIKDFLAWRRIERIRIDEATSIALEQDILSRLLGLGTIVIRGRDGAELRLRSIWKPERFLNPPS